MSWSLEVYQLLTEERIREHHRVALKLRLAAPAALRWDPVQEALAQTLYGSPSARLLWTPPCCDSPGMPLGGA